MRCRRVRDPPATELTGSTAQELRLRRGELVVAQHASGVQLRQLLELGCQVRPGSRRRKRWCWLGRILGRRQRRLLLSLRVGHALLIGHLLLLLGSHILLRVLLLLMVMDSAGCSCHYGGGGRNPCGADEWSWSHSCKHVILQ
jgi:hypothetical protein